ncbi:class II glutamine amidotransferase, partial [Rhizobiaceae sp. 2RAB30]
FFLIMLDEGLAADPQGATARATLRVMEAARKAGVDAALKLTAAFADGDRLHAVRYATDGTAPTLYTTATTHGRCIVSEPFDREGAEWQAIPPGSFVTATMDGLSIRPFPPEQARLALAG